MFQALLETIATALDAIGLPYMVIGGQAVLVHGDPRFTKDIDITLGAGPERLPEVLELAGRQGWEVLPDNPERFVADTLVLPCADRETGIRLDFIFSFSPYEAEALERTKHIQIGNAAVRFVSVEDLIIHKIVAGRPRDLDDVRVLVLKNPDLDGDYVRHWLIQFEQTLEQPFVTLLEKILNESA